MTVQDINELPTSLDMKQYMHVCLELLGHIFILNSENVGKLLLSMYAGLDDKSIGVIANFHEPKRELAFTIAETSLIGGMPLDAFRAAVDGLKVVNGSSEMRELIEQNGGSIKAVVAGSDDDKTQVH